MRNELTFFGHVILWRTRIVIPQALRKGVVSLAHEGHQGVVKTKERLRTKVWWPAMDCDAEKRCAECYGCQMVTKNVPPPSLKSTPLPNQPWEEVAVDLMGPLPSGEHLLVLVDYYSRWMVEQRPAKPSLIAWMPNLQYMDCLKVCVPTMAQILCLKK